MVSGVSVQESARYGEKRAENRWQKTTGSRFSAFCHLTSVIWYLAPVCAAEAAIRGKDLTPETRHLKPLSL